MDGLAAQLTAAQQEAAAAVAAARTDSQLASDNLAARLEQASSELHARIEEIGAAAGAGAAGAASKADVAAVQERLAKIEADGVAGSSGLKSELGAVEGRLQKLEGDVVGSVATKADVSAVEGRLLKLEADAGAGIRASELDARMAAERGETGVQLDALREQLRKEAVEEAEKRVASASERLEGVIEDKMRGKVRQGLCGPFW